MNTWKTYNKEKLDNTIEVKLYNNKIISIWKIVGGTSLDKKGEEINTDDIGWFRSKKDLNRFNKLQKHYETLEQYDFDTLDNFEFALYDNLYKEEDKQEVEELFKKLKENIEAVKNIIEKESKKFLL